jgi:hypothetical protein
MTQFKVHERLPSGFSLADKTQVEEYESTGSVSGASKYAWIVSSISGGDALGADYDLAIRLHPPHRWAEVVSPVARSFAARTGFVVSNPDNDEALGWYVSEYQAGYAAGGRAGVPQKWDDGSSSAAWDDGYLDRSAGRPKWHLTYCQDHDECGEG